MTLPIFRRLVKWPQLPYVVVALCTFAIAQYLLPSLSARTFTLSYAALLTVIAVSSCVASVMGTMARAKVLHFTGFVAIIVSIFLQPYYGHTSFVLLVLGSFLLSSAGRAEDTVRCHKSPRRQRSEQAPQFSTFL